MSPCAAWFRAALAGVFPGGPAESWGFGVGVRGSTLGPPPQLGTLPEDRLFLRRPFRENGAPDFPSLLYIIIISPLRGDIVPIYGCRHCVHLNEVSTRLSCIQLQRWRWSFSRRGPGEGVTAEAILLMHPTSAPRKEASSAGVARGAWAAR